jgi:hypothetical protein
VLVATQQARLCLSLNLFFSVANLWFRKLDTGSDMVDLRDEDDVVYFSPAEAVRPLKKKRQQQVDIIDLSSPTAAEGEVP